MSKRIVAWRAWGLSEDEHGPVLTPVLYNHVTDQTFPERVAHASCRLSADPPHPDHECGLYAVPTREAIQMWLTAAPGVAVIGRVGLIGRTLPGPYALSGFNPLTGTVPGEIRTAATRLKGVQYLHPGQAASATGLACRYGVPFRVAEWVGIDYSDVLIARGRAMMKSSMAALRGETMCPCGEPHWGGTGAAGLVLFNEERTHIVLQRRSLQVDHPRTWALIGGAIDPLDLTPTGTALREAYEEARLDPALLHAEKEITTPRPECNGWTYTYVVATMHWDGTDFVIPNSATAEAEGAAWLPVDVLDHPEHYPKLPLHPELERAWPAVREALR
jgi:8-oxo-dGTP pyrophosphatase MutT (NUDIX family)